MNDVDSNEVNRHLQNLCSVASYSATMDRATAQALLKGEWIFCQGNRRDIKVKHLGLGVYKVYTVKWEDES